MANPVMLSEDISSILDRNKIFSSDEPLDGSNFKILISNELTTPDHRNFWGGVEGLASEACWILEDNKSLDQESSFSPVKALSSSQKTIFETGELNNQPKQNQINLIKDAIVNNTQVVASQPLDTNALCQIPIYAPKDQNQSMIASENSLNLNSSFETSNSNVLSGLKIQDTCPSCFLTFSSHKKLEKHKQRCTMRKLPPDRLTRSLSKINKKKSKRKKSGLRCWKCEICSSDFLSLGKLKEHLALHTHNELTLALLRLTKPFIKDVPNNRNYSKNLGTQSDSSELTKGPTSNVDIDINPTQEKNGHSSHQILQNEQLAEIQNDINKNKETMQSKPNYLKKSNAGKKRQTRSVASGPGSRDPHICPICKKVLSSRGNLSKHMITHKSEKPWTCKVCNIGFNSKRDFDQHSMQKHSNSRPITCELCGKGFICKSILNEHLMFHKVERDYSCEICGKKFLMAKCVKRHMLTHKKGKELSPNSKMSKSLLIDSCQNPEPEKIDIPETNFETISSNNKPDSNADILSKEDFSDLPQVKSLEELENNLKLKEIKSQSENELENSYLILLDDNATLVPINSQLQQYAFSENGVDKTSLISDENIEELIHSNLAVSKNDSHLTCDKQGVIVNHIEDTYVVVGLSEESSLTSVPSTEIGSCDLEKSFYDITKNPLNKVFQTSTPSTSLKQPSLQSDSAENVQVIVTDTAGLSDLTGDFTGVETIDDLSSFKPDYSTMSSEHFKSKNQLGLIDRQDLQNSQLPTSNPNSSLTMNLMEFQNAQDDSAESIFFC